MDSNSGILTDMVVNIDKDIVISDEEDKAEFIEDYEETYEEDESASIIYIKERKLKKSLDQLKTPRQRFNVRWMKLFPWLRAEKVDEALGICIVCHKRLVCKKSHLERHEKSIKHMRLMSGNALEYAFADEEAVEGVDYLDCAKREAMDDADEYMDNIEMQDNELDPDYSVEIKPKKIITSKRVVLPQTTPKRYNKKPKPDNNYTLSTSIQKVMPVKLSAKPVVLKKPIIASPEPEICYSPASPVIAQHHVIKEEREVISPHIITEKIIKPVEKERNSELSEYYSEWIRNSPTSGDSPPHRQSNNHVLISSVQTIPPLQPQPQATTVTAAPTATATTATATVMQQQQPQMLVPKDAFDLYFESVATTVKTFPPKLAAELKSRVSQLMAEFELRAICEQEAREALEKSAAAASAHGLHHCVVSSDAVSGVIGGTSMAMLQSEVRESGDAVPHIVYTLQTK